MPIKNDFSGDASNLPDPDDVTWEAVDSVLAGTYRSNWSKLRQAAYSSAFCCVANAANELLPAAANICNANSHPAERAFLLALNHSNLVGGPALGCIATIAFAQESFVRLGYQLAEELRLQRSRRKRAAGIDAVIAASIGSFERGTFPDRCRTLFRVLRVPGAHKELRAFELFSFRNSIAHDGPLLYSSGGGETSIVKGSPRERIDHFGPFLTLESGACPVRLKHVKAAIDAHDELVQICVTGSKHPEWNQALSDFDAGIGLSIRHVFGKSAWYKTLSQLSKTWEREYQPLADAPLASFIEMRNAMMRRAAMRHSD